MKEPLAMAYVNMYGVLGTLENLCAMDRQAKEILQSLKKPVALCLSVKGGPCCTFRFSQDGCQMTPGPEGCTCKMHFASPEKFNALIDSGKPGLPAKHPVQLLSFLLGPFTKLTDRLTQLLRPDPSAMEDPDFFTESTILTMYTIAGAISALANTDSISKISASYTVDGEVSLGIRGAAQVTILVENHRFTTVKAPAQHPRAVMELDSVKLAHGLFTGQVSTINALCSGSIRLRGMISMVDNINRILDRVSAYLA